MTSIDQSRIHRVSPPPEDGTVKQRRPSPEAKIVAGGVVGSVSSFVLGIDAHSVTERILFVADKLASPEMVLAHPGFINGMGGGLWVALGSMAVAPCAVGAYYGLRFIKSGADAFSALEAHAHKTMAYGFVAVAAVAGDVLQPVADYSFGGPPLTPTEGMATAFPLAAAAVAGFIAVGVKMAGRIPFVRNALADQ